MVETARTSDPDLAVLKLHWKLVPLPGFIRYGDINDLENLYVILADKMREASLN